MCPCHRPGGTVYLIHLFKRNPFKSTILHTGWEWRRCWGISSRNDQEKKISAMMFDHYVSILIWSGKKIIFFNSIKLTNTILYIRSNLKNYSAEGFMWLFYHLSNTMTVNMKQFLRVLYTYIHKFVKPTMRFCRCKRLLV